MIWDVLQAREHRASGHTYADSLHARQLVDIIIGVSGEHAGCWLAIRWGLGRAVAGHVSVPKLAKVTRLSQGRCVQILDDMKSIVVRCGGLA